MSDEAQEQRTSSANASVGFGVTAKVSVRPSNPVEQIVTRAGVISLESASDETRALVALMLTDMDRHKEARERAERNAEEARRREKAERRDKWIAIGVAVSAAAFTLLGWLFPMGG